MGASHHINGWSVQSSMPERFVALCCTEPKDKSAGFEQIARAHDRTRVFRFSYDGRNYYYKEYFFPGVYKLLKDLLRGFWNERAARIHAQLEEAGFAVAHVAATGKKGWRRFMVTEEISGHKTIKLFRRALNEEERPELMQEYGAMVGQLHRRGFSHGDLRWGNILVADKDGAYEFVLIDNERTKFHRNGIPTRLCIKNLVHTRFSGISEGMTDDEWQTFYKAYCSVFPRAQRKRMSWEREMRRKLKQRIRRGDRKKKRLQHAVKQP